MRRCKKDIDDTNYYAERKGISPHVHTHIKSKLHADLVAELLNDSSGSWSDYMMAARSNIGFNDIEAARQSALNAIDTLKTFYFKAGMNKELLEISKFSVPPADAITTKKDRLNVFKQLVTQVLTNPSEGLYGLTAYDITFTTTDINKLTGYITDSKFPRY